MARSTYGPIVVTEPTASTSDDPNTVGFASTALDVYESETDPSPQTDLVSFLVGTIVAGQAVPDEDTGAIGWQGADGYTGAMWVSKGGGVRYPVQPNDLATRTGGVSTVNGASGTVVLDADDLAEGTTNKLLTGTERTKLSGIATGATANSSDAYLLDLENATGVLSIDHVEGVSPGPTVLSELGDMDPSVATPNDGTVAIWSQTAGVWRIYPRAVIPFMYASSESLDPGQPRGLIVDLAAVTVLKAHVMEGTSGTAAAFNTGSVNFSAFNGTTANFSNLQALVGTTSVRIVAGNTGYYSDTGLALDVIVVKRRIRFDGTPTGVVNFAEMRTTSASIAALQRDTTGVVKLKDGSGTTRGTTTTTLDPNTWYIYEWKVGGASQTLRIYNTSNVLLQELSGSATAGQIDTTKHGVVLNTNGGMYLDDSAVAADWLGTAG